MLGSTLTGYGRMSRLLYSAATGGGMRKQTSQRNYYAAYFKEVYISLMPHPTISFRRELRPHHFAYSIASALFMSSTFFEKECGA